jgi:hypothetical protein
MLKDKPRFSLTEKQAAQLTAKINKLMNDPLMQKAIDFAYTEDENGDYVFEYPEDDGISLIVCGVPNMIKLLR